MKTIEDNKNIIVYIKTKHDDWHQIANLDYLFEKNTKVLINFHSSLEPELYTSGGSVSLTGLFECFDFGPKWSK